MQFTFSPPTFSPPIGSKRKQEDWQFVPSTSPQNGESFEKRIQIVAKNRLVEDNHPPTRSLDSSRIDKTPAIQQKFMIPNSSWLDCLKKQHDRIKNEKIMSYTLQTNEVYKKLEYLQLLQRKKEEEITSLEKEPALDLRSYPLRDQALILRLLTAGSQNQLPAISSLPEASQYLDLAVHLDLDQPVLDLFKKAFLRWYCHNQDPLRQDEFIVFIKEKFLRIHLKELAKNSHFFALYQRSKQAHQVLILPRNSEEHADLVLEIIRREQNAETRELNWENFSQYPKEHPTQFLCLIYHLALELGFKLTHYLKNIRFFAIPYSETPQEFLALGNVIATFGQLETGEEKKWREEIYVTLIAKLCLQIPKTEGLAKNLYDQFVRSSPECQSMRSFLQDYKFINLVEVGLRKKEADDKFSTIQDKIQLINHLCPLLENVYFGLVEDQRDCLYLREVMRSFQNLKGIKIFVKSTDSQYAQKIMREYKITFPQYNEKNKGWEFEIQK